MLVMISVLSAQEWTEPVNISNIEGSDISASVVITNNDVHHCVWEHKIETNFTQITYSKSEDGGLTWSNPYSISQNSELWMASPKITSDSQNNLYVTYTYNCGNPYQTEIYFVKFNGLDWSEPVSISEAYNGSNNSTIITDNNDRVYAFWFWFGPYGQIYYKYLENDQWSEIICPYGETDDFYIICEAVVDSENNLHCVGAFNYSWQTSYDEKTSYYFFDYQNNNWQEPVTLGYDTCWQGCDIALDSNEYPHIVWRQYVNNNIPPNDGTLYSYFNGQNWIEPEIIVEDPYCQSIDISNDNIYLLDWEKYESSGNIVIYTQENSGNWIGEIVYSGIINPTEFLCYSNNLLLFFNGFLENSNSDIYFMKKDISTNIINENIIQDLSHDIISLSQNYPNPFNPQTSINYCLNKGGNTTLKILNIKGQLVKTLVNEYKAGGYYSVIWDGTGKNNNSVSSGIYYYRLQVGNRVKTKSLILAK